jgi:ABC-type phosphate transport system permease subunit
MKHLKYLLFGAAFLGCLILIGYLFLNGIEMLIHLFTEYPKQTNICGGIFVFLVVSYWVGKYIYAVYKEHKRANNIS